MSHLPTQLYLPQDHDELSERVLVALYARAMTDSPRVSGMSAQVLISALAHSYVAVLQAAVPLALMDDEMRRLADFVDLHLGMRRDSPSRRMGRIMDLEKGSDAVVDVSRLLSAATPSGSGLDLVVGAVRRVLINAVTTAVPPGEWASVSHAIVRMVRGRCLRPITG